MQLNDIQKMFLKKITKDSEDYANMLFFIENYVKIR